MQTRTSDHSRSSTMSDDDEHLHAALSGRNHAVRFLCCRIRKDLTDAAMISAAEHCGAALRTIDLTNCLLTDDTLFSIAKIARISEIKLSGLFVVVTLALELSQRVAQD